jgi:hypothetical protein
MISIVTNLCVVRQATQQKLALFENMLSIGDGPYDGFRFAGILEAGRCATVKTSG